MNRELLQGFYLAGFHIDPGGGQVTGPAGSVHLPPKALEVLLCLASDPGQLVSRQSLLDAVWGEGAGSPEALTHAVGDIRHALGDHHDHPEGTKRILIPTLHHLFPSYYNKLLVKLL